MLTFSKSIGVYFKMHLLGNDLIVYIQSTFHYNTHVRTYTRTYTYAHHHIHMSGLAYAAYIFAHINAFFFLFMTIVCFKTPCWLFSFSWNSETVNNYLCFLENNSKQIPPEFYFLLSHITYRNLCSISFAFYRLIDWLIKIDRRASSTQILYHLLERILAFCTVYRFLTTNKSKTVYFSSFMYRIPSGRRRS